MKNKPNAFLITTFFLLSCTFTQAQSGFKGTIIDAQTLLPVEFATVSVLQVADSLILTGTITDSTGGFIIENVLPGTYHIKLSFIGYRDTYIENVTVSEIPYEVGKQMLQP
ncbi:MAG: carboxypeptidase regulatory-like domain-containing protein, partial [Chitinophagales bacterium]